MSFRWNKLCAENAVKVVDGVIECVDKKLAENIEEIAEQLRNKVLDCRRKLVDFFVLMNLRIVNILI